MRRLNKALELYRGASPISATLAISGAAAWRAATRRRDNLNPGIERPVRLPGFAGHMRLFSSELVIYRQVVAESLYEFHPGAVVQPDWRIVEIGAHIGFYTVSRGARLDPKRGGRLVAFEADPDNYALLVKNVSNLPQVTVRPQAVFSEVGELDFVSTARSHAGYISGFGSVRADAPVPTGTTVQVLATTLDAAVEAEGLDRIDLLKINAEGAEMQIFDGARERALPVTRRVLMSHEGEAPFEVVRDRLAGFGLHPTADDRRGHYLFIRTEEATGGRP